MMKLDLLTTEAVLMSAPIKRITLPANDGETEIMLNHMPLITPLTFGTIIVEKIDGNIETFAIQSGLADITNNAVVVYARPISA